MFGYNMNFSDEIKKPFNNVLLDIYLQTATERPTKYTRGKSGVKFVTYDRLKHIDTCTVHNMTQEHTKR